jgi:hypothetical protein
LLDKWENSYKGTSTAANTLTIKKKKC